MTPRQRNALITAILLTFAMAVIHAYVRYPDHPFEVLMGQIIGWSLIPWILSVAFAAAAAGWWRMRKKQGSVFNVMISAVFVLLAAQTLVTFTVAVTIATHAGL
jgi:hypothetical protein